MSDFNRADPLAHDTQSLNTQTLIHRSVNAAPTPEGFFPSSEVRPLHWPSAPAGPR